MTVVFDTPIEWKSTNWWRNRSLEERLFHAKIPGRHMVANRTDGPPTTALTAAVLTRWVGDYFPGNSLLITGESQTGKTYQAVNVLTELLTKHKLSGRFMDTDDYIEMVKDSFDSDDGLPGMYSSPYLLKYIKGVWDVLILDGLGQERGTDFAKHEIGSLIRHRHAHMLTTIITSELSTSDIRKVYGRRLDGPTFDMKMVTLSGR